MSEPLKGEPGLTRRLAGDRRARFVMVGAVSAGVELAVFQGAVLVGVVPTGANAISFVIALALSFLGNRLWSFAGEHVLDWRRQLLAYTTLALVNATITTGVIHLAVSAGVVPWAAKVVCMAMVTVWNYLLLNRVIFGRIAGADPQTRSHPSERVHG